MRFAVLDSLNADLPITRIASYSGFQSIRQFNYAMRIAFDMPPSELRTLRFGDRSYWRRMLPANHRTQWPGRRSRSETRAGWVSSI